MNLVWVGVGLLTFHPITGYFLKPQVVEADKYIYTGPDSNLILF